jgi:SAM-dependent methyltransferase
MKHAKHVTEAYAYQSVRKDSHSLSREYEKLVPIYMRRFGSVLPASKNARLLDLPCGSGNVSYFLRALQYRCVDSIDLDEGQVALARALALHPIVADGLDWLKSHTSTYDAIISLDFLEHLSREKALEFLHLSYAALIPGGVLVLRTPCAEGPFAGTAIFNDFTHQWAATSGVLRDLLGMVGFSAISITDDAPVPYKMLNRLRLLAFELTCMVGRFWGSFTGLGSPTVWTPNMWAVAAKSPVKTV